MEENKNIWKESINEKETKSPPTKEGDTNIGPIRDASDPKGAENSGIPGTGSSGNIGTAAASAGAVNTGGKGTADYPNQNND